MLPVLDHGISRHAVLDAEFHTVEMGETLALAKLAMSSRQRLQHSDINVAKIVQMAGDPLLRDDVTESDLICVDGMGVKWACRLLGISVPDRVTGVDLMMQSFSLCEKEGFRPFLFGARQDVLDKMVEVLSQTHPDLQIAGSRNGYFRQDDEAEIVAQIRASSADCLFVGITSPIKERFLRKYRDDLEVPFLVGVGGSFDVVAGKVQRAPPFMQKIGMEWLFRVIQEPRRLFWRYLKTNLTFAAMVARGALRRDHRKNSPDSTKRDPGL
jgi:N-acetylglucosaminyldiphosphoundecaprenol N-acetyl-beta-D-mannosaminyltransferase